MSTFGFARVEISFNKEMPKAFENKENLLEEIDSQLNISDFESSGLSVWFEVSSERLPNLDYQVKQIVKYIADNKFDVADINSSAYSESDYGAFYYNGDDELSELL